MGIGAHVGVVAVTAEGAALCYRTLCSEGGTHFGSSVHPEITMHTLPWGEYLSEMKAGRWEEVGRMLLRSASAVQAAGADFVICPDNTVHQGLDLVRSESPLPWLHIAEEVAREAGRRGVRRVLLLGTRWLMEGPVYPPHFEREGIECRIPDPEERTLIDRTIFNELVQGRFEEQARGRFLKVIRRHERLGCTAVALSCTEIPLLIREEDSPIPTLDSTRILARAALQRAAAE
ncbi:MAG: amino acid racemase [Acidobacteriota bacterium]